MFGDSDATFGETFVDEIDGGNSESFRETATGIVLCGVPIS